MDFLNNLLTAAAGYYGAEQKSKADLKLAQLGLASQTPAAAVTPATAATSQLIPGVSNVVTFSVGAGLLALGIFAVTRK